MTEETIIDGVDVTECQNYNRRKEKCKIPCWINNIKCTGLNCSDIKDCNFKQLKRAEQKLEKVKEYLNSCNLKADFTACDILQIIEGEENE